MTSKLLLEYANFLALIFCASILLLIWRRGVMRDFAMLAAFLSVEALHVAVTIPMMFFRKSLGIPLAWP